MNWSSKKSLIGACFSIAKKGLYCSNETYYSKPLLGKDRYRDKQKFYYLNGAGEQSFNLA